jgi:hypothetical protein
MMDAWFDLVAVKPEFLGALIRLEFALGWICSG